MYHGHNTSHSSPLYAHPLAFQTTENGLQIDYPNPISGERSAKSYLYSDFTVGIEGMTSSECLLQDYSDWTVTIELGDNNNKLLSTIGHGLAYAYFEKIGSGDFQIIAQNPVTEITNSNEVLVFSVNGVKYAAFAPNGSSWSKNGNTYSSSLNGKDYCSIALLPNVSGASETTYPVSDLEEFRKRAYAFPSNTTSAYNYMAPTALVETNFNLSTELKETGNGNLNSTFLCQYPHQWAYSSTPTSTYTYHSPRGEMKVVDGNSFTTEYDFQGVIPTLPDLLRFSETYTFNDLRSYLLSADNQVLPLTESYNQGKHFSKFIQLTHIADQMGETEIRDNSLEKLKAALEEWLTTDASETEYLFHYNQDWDVLIGFPDGHYQASLLNDRHFHWGYFIQAAACIAQYDKNWASKYGEMINLLIKDAANWERDDSMFPYLRNMDPYAGHCWAGGSGSSNDGNNMESSSESMNFNTGVILWGQVTNNPEVRDLGVYLYATECKAIEEYWWDVNDRTFPSDFGYKTASRVFGNGIDLYTFWTADYPDAYAINMLPIQGGSTYLGYHPDYVQANWNDYLKNINADAPQSWNDIFWSYLAFADPELALEQFTNNSYSPEFAETIAHTYHWLHNMNALGQVETSVTADYPLANVFNKEGEKTYVVQNYGAAPLTVTFSDGFVMQVPGDSLMTNRDAEGDRDRDVLVNLAVGKTVTASSEAVPNVAEFLNDQNASTRWESEQGIDPQWVIIDLADTFSLNSILIDWEAANAKDYVIEGSKNGTDWTEMISLTNQSEGNHRINNSNVSGEFRYVRIYGTSRNLNYGYSIFEVEIYGDTIPCSDCVITGETVTEVAEVSVYPNPTTGIVQFSKTVNYYLTDAFGQTILRGEAKNINLSGYSNGVYFIRIENKIIKVLKQ